MNNITDLNQTLPAHFINAGKRVAQLVDERLSTVGLSNAKLWALYSIVSSHELDTLVTVTCLADVMHTTKSNVTAMVDRLIAEGLVTREPSVEDRRQVVIALTEAGKHRYEAGVEVVKALHAELCAIFSAEEQKLLNCMLEKLPF
jgi:DNA-binding MarR family transcriptional regulator